MTISAPAWTPAADWVSPTPRVIVEIDRNSGKLTPLAGANARDEPRDGVGKEARFGHIYGMVGNVDAVYVTDGSLLRRLNLSTAAVTTLMGPASWSGKPLTTTANGKLGAIMLHNDQLYVVDTENSEQSSGGQSQQTVWRYDLATGKVAKLGLGPPGITGLCSNPVSGHYEYLAGNSLGVWCASDGSVYIADTRDSEIEEIPPYDTRRTLAGAAAGQGTDSAGPYMRLPEPRALSSNAAGDIAVFPLLAIVRADDPSTVERYQVPANGPLADPSVSWSIAMGSDNKLYYANGLAEIDELDLATGAVSLVVGAPELGDLDVNDLAYDDVGSLYYSGYFGWRWGLWRVEPSNGKTELIPEGSRFSLIAVDGTRQIFGASRNDAGEWRLGRLDLSTHELTWLPTPPDGWEPSALAYDPSGILYVAEEFRQRVRGLVLATGKVFDLVGKPGEKGLRTGPLATARLNVPTALAILPNGALAIADGVENTVVVVR